MKNYCLVNEGHSSEAAKKTFDAFNEWSLHDPERLDRAIAFTALGRYNDLDEDEQKLADVATDVLDKTENGVRIGATEETWAEVFNDPDHRAAQHELSRIPDDSGERTAALRNRGLCTLRVVAGLHTKGPRPSLEEIEMELAKADISVSV